MSERTRTGLEILLAAAMMGILGNVLLRRTPWGVNAFLFVTIFTAAMVMLAVRRRPELLTVRTLALQGAMVFFGAMFVIRDSEQLHVFDTFAILILMGVLVLPNFGVNARVAGTFHYVAGFLWSGLSSAFAPFVLLGSDIEWKSMPGNRLSRNVFSVLRGLAIALPLVLIFGALFMAADAAYEGMINRAINFELDEVISHVVLTSLFAWLTAGYFRGTIVEPFRAAVPVEPAVDSVANTEASFVDHFAAEPAETNSLPDNATILEYINMSDPPNTPEATVLAEPKKHNWQNFDNSKFPSVFTLGTVETVIILGLINLLFLSFVIVQVPYLFGGMELVQNTPDFKLAEYARRGFGELVAVSALVLPMLLVSHWLLRSEGKRLETLYRVLAGFQIALLFVVMASAVQRLLILTGESGYGLTTVRFYPMVLMIWLAVVFVWFGFTVLRGSRKHFAWGALWSAIVILGATNLMNPDNFIASTNIKLMQQGREFDAHYNAGLSTDAIPALLEGMPKMNLEDRCYVGSDIHYRYRELGQMTDLRSLNYSRRMAFRELRANDGFLHQTEGCPPSLHNDKNPDGTEVHD
ncbi:MAG: DUF4173 domain-containing protein [Pyrinomonadaceae bacterium]